MDSLCSGTDILLYSEKKKQQETILKLEKRKVQRI